MNSEDQQRLLGGGTALKVNKLRGLVCWGLFAVFLVFFIIMASVFTKPQDDSDPVKYLTAEEQVLLTGLGPIFTDSTNMEKVKTQKANALAHYRLGMQLLHMFWYDLALAQFQMAHQKDRMLAMAYFGEALCYKQPLWGTENVTAGQQVLLNIPPGAFNGAPEVAKQYILAAKNLFGIGPDMDNSTTLQQREDMFSRSMGAVYEASVKDMDACAFAGLAMLGQLHSSGAYLQGDAWASMHDRARDQLLNCMENAKDLTATKGLPHAGAMHYLTYVYDISDLDVVQQGVPYAVWLSTLAPKSNLAQHMRSHLYMRLGNYSGVVVSNTDALRASDEYCTASKRGVDCDADNRYHALEWLEYGLTQQCAFTQAKVQMARMQSVMTSMKGTGAYPQWLYRMYAHLQLQSLNWQGPYMLGNASGGLPPPIYNASAQLGAIYDSSDISDHFWPPHAEAHALLARAFGLLYNRTAAQLAAPGVMDTAKAALDRIGAIVAGVQQVGSGSTLEMTALLTTVQMQGQALLMAQQCAAMGNATATCMAWMPLMNQAMTLYATYNASSTLPTLKIAPTPEWYGLLLLATNQNNTLAAAMFDDCLAQLPNRMLCLYGRARAARAAGDMDTARALYGSLTKQCAPGDSGATLKAPVFPPITEARQVMAMVPPPPKKKSSGRRQLASAPAA